MEVVPSWELLGSSDLFMFPWYAPQSLDNRTREELFNEHIKDRDKKEREARKAEKKRRCADFRALLERTSAVKVRD